MRRIIAALAIVALISMAVIGVATAPHRALGQEASPSPGDQAPEGISFQFIAYGLLPQNMEPQEGFSMFRLTFKAGSGFPIEASDPTTALVSVEQGTLTLTVESDITVLHAGMGNQEPTQQDFEVIPAGQQFTMTVGDSAVFPPNTSGQVSNEGTEDVVVLVAQLEPPGYSEGTPGPMMGTPAS